MDWLDQNDKIEHTVYSVIFALLYLQTGPPSLEFAQTQFCLKGDNLRHIKIHPA